MNYGEVEERSSSRSRSPSTARRAAISAILTDTLSRSDRAPTSRTAEARPGWDAGFERLVLALLLGFETDFCCWYRNLTRPFTLSALGACGRKLSTPLSSIIDHYEKKVGRHSRRETPHRECRGGICLFAS